MRSESGLQATPLRQRSPMSTARANRARFEPERPVVRCVPSLLRMCGGSGAKIAPHEKMGKPSLRRGTNRVRGRSTGARGADGRLGVEAIEGFLPHLRQFVRIPQALV